MIRVARETDAAAIVNIYAPVVRDTVISFEYDVPTTVEMASRIAKTLSKYPWLVMEKDGEIVGYVYAGEHGSRTAYQWSANVSVYVHAEYRGRGIAKTLYNTLFDILRRQGYYNAYAGVTLPNDASVALHEAMGFQPIGSFKSVGFKFDAWYDVGWWHLPLRAYTDAPTPVVPFEQLERAAA